MQPKTQNYNFVSLPLCLMQKVENHEILLFLLEWVYEMAIGKVFLF